MRDKLATLKIEHEFSEPFNEDITARWQSIGKAYADGVLSLEESVKLMGVADNYQEEIERIRQMKEASATSIYEDAKQTFRPKRREFKYQYPDGIKLLEQ